MTGTLKTPREAAERLGVSVKTIIGLVDDGALRFVDVGRGKVKRRLKFRDEYLDEFVADRSRKEPPPCRSGYAPNIHPITNSSSKSTVAHFRAQRNAGTGARPKGSKPT
jgi:excisionase family DNA binding protein